MSELPTIDTAGLERAVNRVEADRRLLFNLVKDIIELYNPGYANGEAQIALLNIRAKVKSALEQLAGGVNV